MDKKAWLKYLVYIILIILMVYLRNYVVGLSTRYFQREFRINFWLLTLSMLITIGIGVLLGVEHFINETRKDGQWVISFPKIVLLGIPSLYFSITYFLRYIKNEFIQSIITFPLLKLSLQHTSYISLFQLILGYVIITSFYKCNKKMVS